MTVALDPRIPPRIGPRPLALHMALEGWILQASFAGLMESSGVWPQSNQNSNAWPQANAFRSAGFQRENLRSPLEVVADEAAQKPPGGIEKNLETDGPEHDSSRNARGDALQPAPFIAALAREGHARIESFVRGVRAYQTHSFRRVLAQPPAVWRRGVATLRDYGGPQGAPAVLFVPSLINRAYILDLAEDRSLLRAAAAAGLRGLLLDWGEPGDAESRFAVEDYIDGVLIPALEHVKTMTGQAPRIAGYCIGGTLAVAPAVLRPDLVSGLVLLAAPWDFHSGTEAARVLLKISRPALEGALAAHGCASVDLLQALFASLDPTLVGRKFRRFAALDPASEQARRFVALEDWLNDGVALAGPVAEEIFFRWYGGNDPAQGNWRVGDTVIDPRRIACPTLAFIPTLDRIVPPESARTLARAIPRATAVSVDLGHIGMVSASGAPKRVFDPLIAWLRNPPKP